MKRGKKICQTLKEIRLQVARTNDIPYEPTVCKHKGDCSGTCPKCEQEVRYIEQQLNKRRTLGKAVAVAGVAIGVSMAMQPIEAMAQKTISTPKDSTIISALQTVKVKSLLNEGEKGIVVRGRVVDSAGEPIINAIIIRKGTEKGEVSNLDGMFAIEVPEGCLLEVAYIGFKTFSFKVSEQQQVIEIVLKDDEALLGEVLVGAVVRKQYNDDVYGHSKQIKNK
ncbi:MAG: carboxypeptidase-like regulatory domain-containing protein [Prevotella sp.]|nr:carboxypeptidase-like regulatory domain-containing protein [Prevotella sp.]